MEKNMAYLATPGATVQMIKRYHFNLQKKYGQNFLIDANILKKIIDSSAISKEDCVLEIGPGIGTMTQYLAEAAGKVIAVEVDKNLIPVLNETLSGYDNVTVINEDILKLDIAALAQENNGGRPVKVVANLPYYITTPIIMRLFESHVPLLGITVMVQKEVADRIKAGPGGKDYGVLSLAVQYYAEPEIMMNVSPDCFLPKPGVGSSVIHLLPREHPPVEKVSEEKLFSVIRAAFNQRRKTLANSLANSSFLLDGEGRGMKITRQQVYSALERMGISATVRGEALTLEEFAVLCNLL